MGENDVWRRVALGAVAGLAGTVALQNIRGAKSKLAPDAEAPIRQDPGKRIVPQADVVGRALGMVYGMTFGVFYAALGPGSRPSIRDGLSLGLATWTAGFLGWLPATGLMSPVWKHQPRQFWPAVAGHALYGVATVFGYHALAAVIGSERKR